MNITVQTTGGDEYSLNIKSEIHNNKSANTTKGLMMKSSNRKEPWPLYYQYSICMSKLTENRLCGDVPYLLWHRSIPDYKYIKIWRVRVYIINIRVIRKKFENRSNQGYLMGYAARIGVIIYLKTDQTYHLHRAYHM